jgi:hypothetical protein
VNSEELDKLIELRERIRGLKAVKCRVNHERVKIDSGSGLPLTRQVGEIIYDRIGLCPSEVRAERISCGHTMARYLLAEALSILDRASEGDIGALRTELDEVTNNIHRLDHEKGDAEKHLAELIEKRLCAPESFSSSELNAVNEQIRVLEQTHTDHTDQIDAIRKKILVEIKMVVDQYAA